MTKFNPAVDIDVQCAQCHGPLEASWDALWDRLEVVPCTACLSRAKDEGHDEGYDEGYADGESESAGPAGI